jgi:glycosyltransferase involved in cell wall biosynthesis
VRLCKSILTIHDLAFEYFPECYPKESLSYFKRWIPRAVHNTDRIIAVSENTKSDLVRLYNIRPEKIKVIHNGINMKIMKITTEERLWRRLEDLRIPKQYILTLSTLEPRKNIPVLLKAFQLLKEKHRIEHKLVIGGGGGWLYAKVFEAVRGLELENDVVFTGYVSNEDLPYIYSGASLFVYPSLYEGFGFPPLEAMQCGVPTICSNTSSLPEVVGDGAITFDPKDPKDLAKKILDLLTDTALRTTLSLKGIKRAKRFTWERTVKETYDLYLEVLDSE